MKSKYLVLFIFLLLIAGCMFRLVYNHLDFIIPWYASDYIDLNDDQEGLLERQLKSRLEWHRLSQLPAYASTLQDLKAVAKRGFKREDLDRTHLNLRRHWQNLVKEIAPDLAQIVSIASEDQLKELRENLNKRGEKFKEKYVDQPPEKLREKKVKRMTRFLDFWMDSVTPEQEKIVDDWSLHLMDLAGARLAYMQQSRDRFAAMLAHRHDIPRFTKDLQTLLSFDPSQWPADFKEKADHNREWTKTIFLKIDQSMTAEQRQHFIEKLTDLSMMLEEMSTEDP
jgi:hypothetical protein